MDPTRRVRRFFRYVGRGRRALQLVGRVDSKPDTEFHHEGEERAQSEEVGALAKPTGSAVFGILLKPVNRAINKALFGHQTRPWFKRPKGLNERELK